MRSVLIAAALVLPAGCGVDEDDRPRTLEYIQSAILQPSCATATCHSAFTKADFYDFSSLEATRASFARGRLIDTDEPAESTLILILTSPGGDGAFVRMPYDAPLPGPDVELIYRWIQDGAPGAEQ